MVDEIPKLLEDIGIARDRIRIEDVAGYFRSFIGFSLFFSHAAIARANSLRSASVG
jgi:hypothetical protein